MWLEYISLTYFRNYVSKEFYFKNKKNLIVGYNGSGKTTLLEAIYLSCFSKSFRTNNDIYLINKANRNFYINTVFNNNIQYRIEIGYDRKKKRIKVNEKQIKNLKELVGIVNIVLFLQSDIELIEKSPELRRKFLNILFSQIDGEYFYNLIKYNKLLQYRNKFLKDDNNDINLFYSINENISKIGYIIIEKRKKYIEKLNNIFKLLIKDNSIKLSYKTNINDFNDYLIKMKNNYEKEKRLGFTLIGPHRDDLLIEKDNIKFDEISSTGEKRLISLILKISEFYFIQELKNVNPIVLMDDILMELDNKNIKIFFDMIDVINTQFFITATSIDDYKFLNNIEVINLNE